MAIFLPLLLIFVIFVCALWFHDVWFPPEGRAYKKKRNHNMIESKNDTEDTITNEPSLTR